MPKEKLNFEKLGGLLPVVIQDCQNGEVLMVGFMNEEAWRLTLKTKKVHYYSRKKKRIWMKGEESGHVQHVREIYLDNDNDTLLIKVRQIGGACEDGYRSCFDKLYANDDFAPVGQKVFDPKKVYKNYSDMLLFVIPSGSLYASTIMMLSLAGFQLDLRGERSFKPKIRNRKNITLVVARAQEIPHIIESGRVDLGLTGTDMVEEYDADVTDIADLKYNENGIGEVMWVLAVPKERKSRYKTLKDFRGASIATELPRITRQFFARHHVRVSVTSSVGTTESKAPFFSDAIVDLCETGTSLQQNGLVPLHAIRRSTVHLYAHNHSMAYGWKRRQIEKIAEELTRAAKKLPKNPKRMLRLSGMIS